MNFRLCAALVVLAAVGTAQADIVIGVEDPQTGFIGDMLPTPSATGFYSVASDGEQAFRPFNIPVDVSDAIWFNNTLPWTMDAVTVGWTQLPGQQIWYIDAASVGENEPSVNEPIGYWTVSSAQWLPENIGTWIIQDPDGTWDEIVTWNDGNGAHVSFNSDVPAPGAAALLGLGGLAIGRRRRA